MLDSRLVAILDWAREIRTLTPMSSPGVQLPLRFGFAERIIGRGFLAGVVVRGRALAEQEDEGWWIDGVNPGAIAEGGTTVRAAVADFRQRLKAVLIDYAEEAPDFDAFKGAVEAFFRGTDPDSEAEWAAAREAVRAGAVSLPELPKVTDSSPPSISVERLALAPESNLLDDESSSIAA